MHESRVGKPEEDPEKREMEMHGHGKYQSSERKLFTSNSFFRLWAKTYG